MSEFNIKDYILDPETDIESAAETTAKRAPRALAKYEQVFGSGPDFAIRKTTPRITETLMINVSKKQYFILDEKSKVPTKLEATNMAKFLKDFKPGNDFKLVDVSWIETLPNNKVGCEQFMRYLNKADEFNLKSGIIPFYPEKQYDVTGDLSWNVREVMRYILGKDNEIARKLLCEIRSKLYFLSPDIIATMVLPELRSRSYYYSSTIYTTVAEKEAHDYAAVMSTMPIFKAVYDQYGLDCTRRYINAFMSMPECIPLSGDNDLKQILGMTTLDYNEFEQYSLFSQYKQGYASSNFFGEWRDTLNMEKEIYGRIVEKYPKHLSSLHDQLAFFIRRNRQPFSEEEWKTVVEENLALEWDESRFYQVITPKTRLDFIDEAAQQANCLAGYFQFVLARQSKIAFLRKKKTIDKSWVTFEVKDNKITAAKMRFNKELSEEARKALERYAADKGLILAC